MKYCYNKIHITPDDYIRRYKERADDSNPSHVKLYVEPWGEAESMELSDTIYQAGEVAAYHEHEKGYELFLIDNGTVECRIRGKKALAKKGDLVFIPPHTSHGFKYIDEMTIWRELFSNLNLNEYMVNNWRALEYYPETYQDPEYQAHLRSTGNVMRYDHEYEPVFRAVDVSEIPEIIPFDQYRDKFDFPGISMRQKVHRSQWNGLTEIWQYLLERDFRISWDEWNRNKLLYIVFSGSLRVKIDGMDKEFIARERDILSIPNFLGGEMVTLEDTVLFNYNCTGYLFRALEEITSLAAANPEKAPEEEIIKKILNRNNVWTRGGKL